MTTTKAVIIPTSIKSLPYTKEITLNDFREYNKIIGSRCFDLVTLYQDNNIQVNGYVDDEGRLNNSPVNDWFFQAYMENLTVEPLYGIIVITMSSTKSGDDIESDLMKIKEVLKTYSFTEEDLINI